MLLVSISLVNFSIFCGYGKILWAPLLALQLSGQNYATNLVFVELWAKLRSFSVLAPPCSKLGL